MSAGIAGPQTGIAFEVRSGNPRKPKIGKKPKGITLGVYEPHKRPMRGTQASTSKLVARDLLRQFSS